MSTVGTRVGKLYDLLANPSFEGPKAEAAMKEYLFLTRHPEYSNDALFLVRNSSSRSNVLANLLIFGGAFLFIIMWLRVVKRAVEADRTSHREVLALKKRIKDTLDREFPNTVDYESTFGLPEGFFNGIE